MVLLISRIRDKNDERNVIIKITKSGKELKDKAKDIPTKMGSCVNISEEEAKFLYKILYIILNNIEED